ncbi:MAG: outer membrane beta-barrel protein [Hyphomicrobiaceae bacterium]
MRPFAMVCATLGALAVAVGEPAYAQSFVPGGWSGPYWGLSGGGAWAETKHATKFSDLAISGHIGYGVRFSALYLGAEVDATWGGVGTNSYLSPLYSSTLEVDWSTTVRGRAGFAMNGILVYATGGVAWSGQTLGVHSLGGGEAVSTKTVPGLVYGAGIEMKVLPFVSARVEALHYDFTAQGKSFSSALPGSIGAAARSGLDLDETVVRAGLSIRFN